MIHPSYVELMKVVNDNVNVGEEPVVNSRYSIVAATAKRARQIVGGAEPLCNYSFGEKPLSIAVRELYERDLVILTDEEAAEKKVMVDEAKEIIAEHEAKERALMEERDNALLEASGMSSDSEEDTVEE
ncbi:MAG: DNA-directed RNA polymerase subunit omega [Lachnospiraceae bacterium]|nr:DNA-directed RNA polymerase subunit omega [Lachnospiraceae bacterium]